ncbi:MAG: GntR family transcriptional regulator [Bacillota bacterium]|nr:GntR family transcriptional regulator [Bacillota bacterium]
MFELDVKSRTPIYEQLVEKIKELIISNVLKPDEQLPAVRVLASDLTVNPNTVQKAYRELEYRGYIYSVPGKGNFVKASISEDHSSRVQALEKELMKIITEMLYLGVPCQELLNRIETLCTQLEGGIDND